MRGKGRSHKARRLAQGRRLQELADSPDQRKRFGLEASKRFEDMFRLEVSAQAFHAFYKMSPGQTERPVTEQSDSR